MKIEHASMHQGDKRSESEKPEIPVHTVVDPADEELFKQQMALAERAYEEVSDNPQKSAEALRDPVLEGEINKQKVFEKLVLFKEDHCKVVKLADLEFKLRLINAMDNSFIMKEARKEPVEDQMAALSLLILAASLVDINSIPFESFYTGPSDIEHPTLRKYYELKQWAQPIVTALQGELTKFREEVEKQYSNDFLGK